MKFEIKLENTRKLCDLKPMYGFIFEDYIQDFEYWAHGDIDLVFGDLQNNLPNLLENFDVLTFHDKWISGPFTIFRNNQKTNEIFKTSKDLIKILSDPSYLGFDECGRKFNFLVNEGDILNFKKDSNLDSDIECMTFIMSSSSKKGDLKFYQETRIKESILLNERVDFINGKLYHQENELFVYHFITEKQYIRFKFKKWKKIPNEFYFLHTGIYKKQTLKIIVNLNYYSRIIYNEFYRFFGRIYISFNYRILNRKDIKLKFRIDRFR